MQQLLNNLEIALKSVIEDGATGIQTFLGQDDADQVRPNITVYAQQGEERPIGSGNFLVNCVISIRSEADDTSREDHRNRCNAVFGLIMVNDLGAKLSSQSDLAVYDPVINRQASHGKEDNCWLSELRFECYCCLLDIA